MAGSCDSAAGTGGFAWAYARLAEGANIEGVLQVAGMVTGQMAEVSQRDRFDLADLASVHPLGADLFVPFTVVRLGGQDGAPEAELLIELRGIGAAGPTNRRLEVCRSAARVPAQPLAIS